MNKKLTHCINVRLLLANVFAHCFLFTRPWVLISSCFHPNPNPMLKKEVSDPDIEYVICRSWHTVCYSNGSGKEKVTECKLSRLHIHIICSQFCLALMHSSLSSCSSFTTLLINHQHYKVENSNKKHVLTFVLICPKHVQRTWPTVTSWKCHNSNATCIVIIAAHPLN